MPDPDSDSSARVTELRQSQSSLVLAFWSVRQEYRPFNGPPLLAALGGSPELGHLRCAQVIRGISRISFHVDPNLIHANRLWRNSLTSLGLAQLVDPPRQYFRRIWGLVFHLLVCGAKRGISRDNAQLNQRAKVLIEHHVRMLRETKDFAAWVLGRTTMERWPIAVGVLKKGLQPETTNQLVVPLPSSQFHPFSIAGFFRAPNIILHKYWS
ncbi:hypothetical protein DFH07DRAFT_781108 [Mycena maculata]|uniref:Uncharacterized protein n=1 Tax=Mycena maculata TaxID=230809 RepID=A0AAD7I1S5_9AGAR|nr:hypothetical protein DFH07DRAFT_781108 [Mycena maculata]